MLGDFNDIASHEEQWGSDVINQNKMTKFREAVNNYGLFELKTMGAGFSWVRHVGGRVTQQHKLDKIVWNMEAQLQYPKAKAIILPITHLDHHPIKFVDQMGGAPPRELRPFRFEAAWLTQ